MPSNVAAPTNLQAAGVCTTRTDGPPRGQPDELNCLVGGDPTGYAEQDPRHELDSGASAVAVLDLARGDLLEGDLQVVLRARLDHRRRVLVERALAEVVVVGVDLAGALGGHEHARVVGVDLLQQCVQAGLDHQVAPSSATHRSDEALELLHRLRPVVVDDHVGELLARPPAPRVATREPALDLLGLVRARARPAAFAAPRATAAR